MAREDLIGIARRAFAQHGYAGTSIRVVAEEAGLTKAALFHHFDNKEGMYLEAMRSVLDALGALVAEAARSDTGTAFLERLDQLGAMSVDYLSSNPEAARLLTREFMERGFFMQRGGDAMVDGILALIAAFLESAMREGTIPTQDPRQLALSITGLHIYLFVAPQASARFLGEDIFSDAHRRSRIQAIQQQIRRLCGAPPG